MKLKIIKKENHISLQDDLNNLFVGEVLRNGCKDPDYVSRLWQKSEDFLKNIEEIEKSGILINHVAWKKCIQLKEYVKGKDYGRKG